MRKAVSKCIRFRGNSVSDFVEQVETCQNRLNERRALTQLRERTRERIDAKQLRDARARALNGRSSFNSRQLKEKTSARAL